jgi:hypothetical protein
MDSVRVARQMRDAYGLKPKDRPAIFLKCKVPEFERSVAQVTSPHLQTHCTRARIHVHLYLNTRTFTSYTHRLIPTTYTHTHVSPQHHAARLWEFSDSLQVLDTAKLLASAGSLCIMPVGRCVAGFFLH